jgi:predicted AAA+ superfamily ATPase
VSDEFGRASRIGANGYALSKLVDYGEAILEFERAVLNLRSCIDTYDTDHKDAFEPDATMASLLGDPINNIVSNTSSDYTYLYAVLRKKWERTKLKVRRDNTCFVEASIGALKKDPGEMLPLRKWTMLTS